MITSRSQFHPLIYSTLVMSTLMIISSQNWLMLWCALEINLMSFIPIIMSSNKFQETEASAKYFLAQALGSSMILMSSTMLWATSFIPTSMNWPLIVLALTIKLGMIPCHTWFPSVMNAMSWIPNLILSSWQKVGPLMTLTFLVSNTNKHSMILAGIACINALGGGLMGLNQSKFKSLMAYSSITHMGWMTSSMVINKPLISLIYLIMYALMISPLFVTFYLMNIISARQLNKLPVTLTMSMSFMILSVSGVPPFTGFLPKWMMMSYLWIHPILLMMLIMGAMMNMFFYLNMVFSTYITASNNIQTTLPQNLTTMLSTSTMMLAPMTLFMLY